jgi:hypothetical protein
MMARRCLGLAATATALVVVGCGGSSHNAATASTATNATAPPSSVALPPEAPPALRGVFGRVLTAGELAGFTPQGRRVLGINASSWVAGLGLPPSERAKEAARLQRLGFVAAVSERLAPTNGAPAEALSIVEQFGSPSAAKSEVAAQLKMTEAQGAKGFAVPGIPGASGFGGSHGQGTGIDVLFAAGPYYYLVGAGWPIGSANPPTRAALIAAAEHLYHRLYG